MRARRNLNYSALISYIIALLGGQTESNRNIIEVSRQRRYQLFMGVVIFQ